VDDATLKPRKRPGQLRARETVDRILDAAAHIFQTTGYAGTTTNHIASEATVSIGSLYQYYPNKDAIIVGLAERHIDAITAQFTSMIDEFRSQRRPVAEVVPTLLGATATLTGTSDLHALLLTGCPRTPELEAQLKRFENTVTCRLALLLAEANVETKDVKLLARLLFVAGDAALHQVVLPRRTKQERIQAIEELSRLLTQGLRTRTE
jgi:AcrR family transcriptional regulator